MTGDRGDRYAEARRALLDALEALGPHTNHVMVIGAQAVYLHTGEADVAIASFTVDGDLAVDPRTLEPEPLIEEAMTTAGFELDQVKRQPGAWISPSGMAVDLMVPEAVAGAGGRRSGRIPPHSSRATRRAVGLEASVIDHQPMDISGAAGDDRLITANVAGPAALLVAKLHKLGERQGQPDRLLPKDAHDVYRLLVATGTRDLASSFRDLLGSPLASEVTDAAIRHLGSLFAAAPDALGSQMAGEAEAGVGEPEATSDAPRLVHRRMDDGPDERSGNARWSRPDAEAAWPPTTCRPWPATSTSGSSVAAARSGRPRPAATGS